MRPRSLRVLSVGNVFLAACSGSISIRSTPSDSAAAAAAAAAPIVAAARVTKPVMAVVARDESYQTDRSFAGAWATLTRYYAIATDSTACPIGPVTYAVARNATGGRAPLRCRWLPLPSPVHPLMDVDDVGSDPLVRRLAAEGVTTP